DLSGYVFRAYHALPPMTTSRGEPVGAVHGFVGMLLRLIGEHRPAMLAVAVESRRGSFREERYPDYKAHREIPPDIPSQIERCRQVCEAFGLPVFEVDRAEADDVIASLCARARTHGLRVVVCSADKDLLQLVDERVLVYDAMRGKVYGPQETVEKMGVPPSQVRDLLALQGDASDNVPGVPGIGPKTAAELLRALGSLEGVYAGLETIARPRLRESLRAHKVEAYLSRELVTLRDDLPIPFDPERLRFKGGDREGLARLLAELEMSRHLATLRAAASSQDGGSAAQGEPERAEQAVARVEPTRSWRAPEVSVVESIERLAHVAQHVRATGRLGLSIAIDGADSHLGELCGLGLADGSGSAWYVPLVHRRLEAAALPSGAVVERLAPLFADPELTRLSADAKNDEIALERLGLRLGTVRLDAMLASYLLEAERHGHDLSQLSAHWLGVDLNPPAELRRTRASRGVALAEAPLDAVARHHGARAAALVALEQPVRERLWRDGLLALHDELEVPLAHVLAVMERTGIRLDPAPLRETGRLLAEQTAALAARCRQLVGHDVNLASPKQLETVLFDELGLRPRKRTRTGRSTDAEVLEELAEEHELPGLILQWRALDKLESTYVEALPRAIRPSTGRVHTRFQQAVAATGRLSSTDPNLQNIPVRTELGRRIREAFVPTDGWLILSSDYSQIELRLLAHLSGDPALVDAFVHGLDVHVQTASAIFGVPPESVDRAMRARAKTVNFAVLYGQSAHALSRNLETSHAEAQRIIDAFFERYRGVRAYFDRVVEDAREHGFVTTLLGRRRRIAELHASNRAARRAA
ncbi:MAG: DNA polymerase I, partial [Myxococcota bacterium]|nr:DNA polymerase I [Myxococcota bacterium]